MSGGKLIPNLIPNAVIQHHHSAVLVDSSSSVTPHPVVSGLNQAAAQFANLPGSQNQQKYSLLLATIEEIGKQIRPAHTGNKNAVEQMKRHIAFAKLLIRELLSQVDINLNNMAARERNETGFSSPANIGGNPRKKQAMNSAAAKGGMIRNG